MRVLRVHLRTGVAGEFLSDFHRDACVRHGRVEAMPQAVKAEAAILPPVWSVLRNLSHDARLHHDV